MKMPPQAQIEIAVMWLQNNEGAEGESDACKAVAAWLEHVAYEDYLRRAARAGGVPVATLRRKLAAEAKS